jgi:hypothetical protein
MRHSRSVTKRDTTDIAEGSLKDIAAREDISLAEAFAGARLIIMLDVSGSMEDRDAPTSDGLVSRHAAAEQQVRRLQSKYEGKVALFCFSNDVLFAANGVPIRLNGGTAMNGALEYIKRADNIGLDIVLISDGQPTDGEEETLRTASTFKQKIDCIYIGADYEQLNNVYGGYYGRDGKEFLRILAERTGGRFIKTEEVAIFEEDVERLLLTS